MQPMQIGGGELAQSIWFSLKALGVKSSTIMSVFIQHVGTVIQEEALASSLFEELYNFITSKEPPQLLSESFKDEVRSIFDKAVKDIKQFITTNIPHLINSGSIFSLSFNGSSLLVATNSKRGVN